MSVSTLQLSTEETKIRIEQGIELAKVNGTERTRMSKTFRITNSAYVTDQVQVARMFGPDSNWPWAITLITPWSSLIALARKKDTLMRIMLAELVYASVEAEQEGREEPFSFRPDGKLITHILNHPELYRRDLEILTAKLHATRGLKSVKTQELTATEAQLVTLETPDLIGHIKAQNEQVTLVRESQIEVHLEEIQNAIVSLDENIVELELSAADEESTTLTSAFVEDMQGFMAEMRGLVAGLDKSDQEVIAGQQGIIDALRMSLQQAENDLVASQQGNRELRTENAELRARLADIQAGLALIGEKLPAPIIVESANGTNHA